MRTRYLAATRPYALVMVWLVPITGGLWLLRSTLTLANFSLIYVLIIVIFAIWLGTTPSLFAAVVSFFCFNFFLIQPLYTLRVEDRRDLLDLLLFLIVAVITSQLAAYGRRQAAEARRRATEENALFKLSSAFNQLTDRESVITTLTTVIQQDLDLERVEVLPPERLPQPVSDPARGYLLIQSGPAIFGALQTTPARGLTDSTVRLLVASAVQAGMALHRIELAEAAQQSRALEQADQLKTALLRVVSHDLRTPLTIITSSAGNLRALHDQLSLEQQMEMLRAIETETSYLDRMVGDLLSLSRLQAGAMPLHADWYPLAEVAGEVAALAWEWQGKARLKLTFPDDLPLAFYDLRLMVQATANIVENALRYEPEDSLVELRGETALGESRLLVINHGPTIPEEDKERIMEPFWHGEGRTTGLGLAISKGLVEAHQGRLWVEDTPRGGATFILALPLPGEGQPHVDPDR